MTTARISVSTGTPQPPTKSVGPPVGVACKMARGAVSVNVALGLVRAARLTRTKSRDSRPRPVVAAAAGRLLRVSPVRSSWRLAPDRLRTGEAVGFRARRRHRPEDSEGSEDFEYSVPESSESPLRSHAR